MSFCLHDGSPLIMDSNAATQEKPLRNTSPNEILSGSTPQTEKRGRSYFPVFVGLVSLVLVFFVATMFVGGVWLYFQTRTAVVNNETETEKPGKTEVERTPKPAKEKGAVTSENYKKVKTGMSYKEVVEIFGEEGEEMSSTEVAGFTMKTYSWKPSTFANVTLTFRNDKLMNKFQMGLK